MIYVSRTKLPPIENYVKQIKRIWKSNWLTNNGELVQELEKKLQNYWGVKHVVCVSNGTTAIQIALKALGIKNRINMYPDSFIATGEAPVWIGVKPNFVDIDKKLQGPALVTHIYGIPHLITANPVIYDASHAFTMKSIFGFGDISIISFHAVKIFQTVEGGALVTNNDKLAEKARWMRNHGFKTHYSFYGAGTNAKMSEFHAAMGLCVLPMVNKVRKKFDGIIGRYNDALGYGYEGVTYYPIYYNSESAVLKAIKTFEKNRIFPRRYFYPPLNKVFGGKSCPIAEDLMSRVLCLPLYYDLTEKEQDFIIKIANDTL